MGNLLFVRREERLNGTPVFDELHDGHCIAMRVGEPNTPLVIASYSSVLSRDSRIPNARV